MYHDIVAAVLCAAPDEELEVSPVPVRKGRVLKLLLLLVLLVREFILV
jgi:hypothetical protein